MAQSGFAYDYIQYTDARLVNALASLGHSVAHVKIWESSIPYGPKYGLPKKLIWVGQNAHPNFVVSGPKFTRLFFAESGRNLVNLSSFPALLQVIILQVRTVSNSKHSEIVAAELCQIRCHFCHQPTASNHWRMSLQTITIFKQHSIKFWA